MNEGSFRFSGYRAYSRADGSEAGLNFRGGAWKRPVVSNVFTTHTSVPAGIDLFDSSLVYDYFVQYCAEAGFPFEKLLVLGRKNLQDPTERFLDGRSGP